MRDIVAERVNDLYPTLVERRRDFHRHPELGFREVRTAHIVAECLSALGIEVRTGVAETGIVGRLRGAGSGKTIALRADMDALPIQDLKPQDYASTVAGRMHACGHDAHVTMALGAATVLAAMRSELAGDVVFLFSARGRGDLAVPSR